MTLELNKILAFQNQTKRVVFNNKPIQPQSSLVNEQMPKTLQHCNLMFGSMKPVINSINNSTIPVVPGEIPSLTTLNSKEQTITDLSGDWKYFLGDELPKNNAIETGTMNLPSNWFLMGKKEFPAQFKVDETKLFDVQSGEKPNPEKGLNYSGTIFYKKDIDINEAPDPNKPHFLDLDMVDYYGQVYVNGKPVGKQHEGYFQPWSVNLTEAKDEKGQPLLKKGKNEIIIKVSKPEIPFDGSIIVNGQQVAPGKIKDNLDVSWPGARNRVDGILGLHDCRPGGPLYPRGQECSTGGIIRGLKLRQSSGADILSTKITTVFDPKKVITDGADVKMQFTVTNLTDKPKEIVVRGEISPNNFKEKGKTEEEQKQKFSKTVTILPHETMQVEHSEHVNNPKLWWTRDKGYPHLYQSTVKIEEVGEDGNSKPLDQKLNVFGVRSMTRDQKGVHYINGERFYVRGTNYIPSQYMSQADKKWYEEDISAIKDANLNTVLVHAHITRPEFYDLCDREGLAVKQGFPLVWKAYTKDPAFAEDAKNQAKDMVNIYGNHPSIVEWIVHNEDYGNQNPELNNQVEEVIKAADSSRLIIKNAGGEHIIDANGFARRTPETKDWHTYPEYYVPSQPGYTIDDQLSEGNYVDEFGAQALSNKNTLKKIFNNLSLPKNPQDFASKDWYPWRYAGLLPEQMFNTSKINPGKNVDDLIKNSQKFQARLLQYEIEYLRRHKWDKEKPNNGEVEFMLVDPWRAASSWAVIDYDRTKKEGYYAVKKSNQPLLPSIKYEWKNPNSPVEIVLINDNKEQYSNLTVEYQVGANKVKTQKIESLEGDSVKFDDKLKINDEDDKNLLPLVIKGDIPMKVWIKDSQGKVISENSMNN
ncbi:MAG: glycoside hydrolase family 2 TIM barrel-domain containing protein [Candidatus Gastranaerophilaceae bacterium]|jgi:beta-mannosidase